MYRIEKEENGKECIVIDGFDKGIAPDPYSGLNLALQVNLETPGEISAGYPITSNTVSGATLTAPIAKSVAWFTSYTNAAPNGSPSKFAMLDASGHVFESTSITGTWNYLSNNASLTGASSLDGIAYYLGYLIKFRNNKIDYWDGTIWVNDWQTITGGVKHFGYVATDNILYFTNGNYVGSISLADPSTPTSFVPGTSSTYVFSATKLQLPETEWATSLGEVGGGNTPQSTLLVGGIQNAIYPWDKTSSTFAYPIFIADNYIYNIVSANQNAFIFAGKNSGRGRIYITNGAQAEVYFKIPDYIFNIQDPYYEWGDAIFHRNNLIFGFFIDTNSTASLVQDFGYVWAIKTDNTKAFRAISNLTTGVTNVANATALISPGNLSSPGFGYIVGWSNNSTAPGIGYSGTTAGTSATAVIRTELISVGTFLQKKTFTQVEYKLRTALQSGENIIITPIVDGVAATVLTFSPTVAAGEISGTAPVTFQANQWIQFQIVTAGNSASSGVRIKELRVR